MDVDTRQGHNGSIPDYESDRSRRKPDRVGDWSESALRVLRERYLMKRNGQVVETPDEMCRRVARAVAEAETRYHTPEEVNAIETAFYQVMAERKFMPNSPTLMNAGTGNGLQYSACYVLPVGDSIDEIFDSLKNAAIIHQSGGGCISGDAHVFTTFCGVEAIETLYSRVRATGRDEEDRGDHAVMDVRDLGIRTMALNPKTGSYRAAPVTHLWRYNVPLDSQIRMRAANGLEVTTSSWHPFMIFDGRELVERRADELRQGDILALPNGTVREAWPHEAYRDVAGTRLDEDVAWLLGYWLGDGSLGWAKIPESNPRRVMLRWRLFDGRREALDHASAVLANRFDVHVRVRQDSRGLYSLTTTDRSFIDCFRSLLPVEPGPKTDLPFPEMVAKSPLSVVGAFLGGLVDSDGTVDVERGRVTFTTASRSLAGKVHTLCALLGLAPGLRRRRPYGKGKVDVYEVRLSSEPHLGPLRELIGPYLHDKLKSRRLADNGRNHSHVTATRLPIPFTAIEDVLESVGISTRGTAIHRQPTRVNGRDVWLHRWREGLGVSAETLLPLVATLRPIVGSDYQDRLDLLERLARNATTVSAVERPERAVPFYDFTVAGHSTYLAGTNGLTAIHNTGFAFSRIRRKDSLVSRSGGRASGPVSFLRVYNAATEAVKQGGTRRGANMGILRVDHPDVLEFIDCKNDGGITNFNISVAITDAFMDALKNDDFYDLVDPHSKEMVSRLRAREVWDKIVDSAWRTGDPGLVFIDRINGSPANPTPEVGAIEATNPCVIGETRLATSRGLVRVDELFATQEALLVATDARVPNQTLERVVNGSLSRQSEPVFHAAKPIFRTGENVPVWRLTTSHGIEITATPYHKFLTPDGYKALDELEYGDTLLLQSGEGAWSEDASLPPIEYGKQSEWRLRAKMRRGEANPPSEWCEDLGEVVGYVLGDGWLRRDNTADALGIAIDDADEPIVELITRRLKRWFGASGCTAHRQNHVQLTYKGTPATFLLGLGLTPARGPEKRVPESVFRAPREAVVGFLRGLFSADGTVNLTEPKGSCSVRLATSSKELARDVQQLLLNLGIVSSVRLRRAGGTRLMPDARREPAEYYAQAQYEVILDRANRDRFVSIVGFLQERKQWKVRAWIEGKSRRTNAETFATRVASIEPAGTADVYCTTEPVTHSIIVNGLTTANCGEQPLLPNEACNLGSLNVARFVTERDGIKDIDWTELERVAQLCTRFLDDVIEVNPYPLPEIDTMVKANRRIGLGIMGWADLLFDLGIPYDSEEAIELADRMWSFVERAGHQASQQLAVERGPFPNWHNSIYKDGPPMRNSTVTTIAPTGTISIIADASSGIEPIFALAFQHKVDDRTLTFVNPHFVDAAKRRGIHSDDLMERVSASGTVHDMAGVPDDMRRVFVTAHEVAPEWHVRTQAAFQHHTDNGVSKTINLPNSADKDDVEDAYKLAWDLGCLGITVFRDGSKGAQVLNVGVDKKDESAAAEERTAQAALPGMATIQPRPAKVSGTTHRIATPVGTAFVTVNSTDEGEPHEAFVNIGRAGSDIAADAAALGRLISLVLRMPSTMTAREKVAQVVDQLAGIGGSRSIGFGAQRVLSLPDALAQVLSEYTEDETAPRPTAMAPLPDASVKADICPTCGWAALTHEEGCKKCHFCGYSEC